jgi:hypothetical protein
LQRRRRNVVGQATERVGLAADGKRQAPGSRRVPNGHRLHVVLLAMGCIDRVVAGVSVDIEPGYVAGGILVLGAVQREIDGTTDRLDDYVIVAAAPLNINRATSPGFSQHHWVKVIS